MPNWVTNNLMISGDEETIQKLFKKIRKVDKKNPCNNTDFDFNRVIKMPASLDIPSGSETTIGENVYMSIINPDTEEMFGIEKYGKVKYQRLLKRVKSTKFSFELSAKIGLLSKSEVEKLVESRKAEVYGNAGVGIIALGKTVVNNILKYGTADWYNWCTVVWGSKWNACDVSVCDKQISFQTAWSPVPNVILELSKMFPDLTFDYFYCDEDFGNNVGAFYGIKNGNVSTTNIPDNGSDEAIRLAAEIDGYEQDELENMGYVLDPVNDKYANCYCEYTLSEDEKSLLLNNSIDPETLGFEKINKDYVLKGCDQPNDLIAFFEKKVFILNEIKEWDNLCNK